jgi:hypothetical protein
MKLVRYRLRHLLILSDIIYHIMGFITVNEHAILTAFLMMCVCVCLCVSVPNFTCLAPVFMFDIKQKSKQTFPRCLLDVLQPQNVFIWQTSFIVKPLLHTKRYCREKQRCLFLVIIVKYTLHILLDNWRSFVQVYSINVTQWAIHTRAERVVEVSNSNCQIK